jgi:hypothetical protein
MSDFTFAKINILVRDLQSAIDYACNMLGAKLVTEPQDRAFGQMAVVAVGGLSMEIVQPAPGNPLERSMEKRGQGFNSIGFSSPDVPAVADELSGRGAQFLTGRTDLAGTAWLHPKNPLSLSIEFFSGSHGH